MKILLINPPFSKHGPYSVRIPLGVTYLASSIKDNYKIKILDLQLETVKKFKPVTNIKRTLESFKPDIVCICHIIAANYPCLKILAKQVKEFNQNIKVITGGYFPTVNPKTTLKDNKEFLDIIVRGEGEKIFPKLLSLIKKNKKIKKVVLGKAEKNLNKLPFPSRDLLNIKEYRKYSYAEDYTLGSIITSRGCPFQCSWCGNKEFMNYRERSVDNIIDEIKIMKSKYNIHKFKIEDETFTYNRKRVIEFCRKIKPLKVIWFIKTRADLIDDKLIEIMYNAGMKKILIGFEDLNINNIRKLKGFSKKDIDYNHLVSEIHKYKDLKIVGTFLIGHEKIKPKEIIKSLKWADKKFKKGDYIFMSHFLPPKIDDLNLKKFKKIDLNFSHWTLCRPIIENESWSIKDYRKINKVYRKIIRKKFFFPYISSWNNDLIGYSTNNIKSIYRKIRNKWASLIR